MENTGKLRKLIHSQARNVIKNVIKFFDTQKSSGSWSYPLDKATELAAAATGVSIGLIKNIRREMKVVGAAPLVSPKKKHTTPAVNKIHLDDMDKDILRRTVHESYVIDHQVPTVNTLLVKMQEKINYAGQRETLRKHLHEIGFTFKTCPDKRKLLMERSDIVTWRSQYLRIMRDNDR